MATQKKSNESNIREIAISEFFAKNRHLLGFDNPAKSLLTAVREAVDNALDACEEAHILPEIKIVLQEIKPGVFSVLIEDNGPGIAKSHLANIFAKLLYGSKFHRLKQSRGQQGIGISAAVMYGQMTTGKPAEVISKTKASSKAHKIILQIDTKKNAPHIMSDTILNDAYWSKKECGTSIKITLEGAYKDNKHGVLAYIRQTSLANPHANFIFIDHKGEEHVFPRLLNALFKEPLEIKPHPHGIELGTFMELLKEYKNESLDNILTKQFCRISQEQAKAILKEAKIKKSLKAKETEQTTLEKLYQSLQNAKIMAPPTNCLSPLNKDAIEKALFWFFAYEKTLPKTEGINDTTIEDDIEQHLQSFRNEENETILSEEEGFFLTAVTRPPAIYRGNPFQIEVGLFYGKSLSADDQVQIYRFANRVPLQYQASACAMTKAVMSAPWKSYGLNQSKGALPTGPLVLMVSITSVWVPYTSESKEALAHYPEILKELRLAIMEAGRNLQKFLNKKRRHADESKKRKVIEKFLDPISESLKDILGNKVDEKQLAADLKTILEKTRAHKEVKLGHTKIASKI